MRTHRTVVARAGEVEKGAEEAEVEVEAVFFERVEERGSVDKRRRLDFRSVVVEEEKREESQRFLLPPIELRSLPEHEAMSKAAALLLLLLRCRPAERREASMASREGKFEKIVRELKEEVCHSFSTRLALGERNTKPKKKKTDPVAALSRDAAVVGPASCGGWFPASFFRTSGTGRLFPRPPAKETSQRRLPRARLRGRRRRKRERQRQRFRVVVDASPRKRCLFFTSIFPFVLPPASASCDT